MTRRVDHVWFWVGDMDRAVVFYHEELGLKLRYRSGDEWAEFEAGDVRLGLHGHTGAGPRPSGGTVMFRVDDLDLAVIELEARGIRFHEKVGEVPGTARFVHFSDPDGNALGIIEYRDGAH